MTITDNQLKGNWGEDYIASNLAANDCFVRRVTQGLDTGIDLYCEMIKDGEPFLHFWCQVKTSEEWSGEEEQVSAPSDIEKYKEYWLRQPVPVFIFLVPDLRDQYPPYYICSVFDYWWRNNKKSFLKIKPPKDLSTFLNEHLVVQTFFWDLKDGKVRHLKTTPKQEYTLLYPSGVAHIFEQKLFKSLHTTLWRLSQDILFHDIDPEGMLEKAIHNNDEIERIKKAKPYVKALKILIEGKNDEHYQNYATVGHCYELEKEYGKSLKYYKISLSKIRRDPKIKKILEDRDPLDEEKQLWESIIEGLNQHIDRVKSKMSKAD